MARVNVSNEDFVAACLGAKSIEDIAKATGLAATTVQQRRVRLRNAGVPIAELTRGGGRKASKTDLASLNSLIAKHTGKSVEEVAKESEALVAAHAERTAEKAVKSETEKSAE